MARLTWGNPSERFYENGVDQGVLYVDPDNGVAWNGLISVEESPIGGEARPTYLDGVKIRNFSAAEEYEATIDTFSAPVEFRPCDGISAIQNGLLLTQQPRKSFNFSYRTMIGTAANKNHGYKIHLVYNALAAPSSRSNQTLGSSDEVINMSWTVTTRPPLISGIKPTAHVIIDTREVPAGLIPVVESIVYGDELTVARIPSITELIDLFESYV